MLSESVWLTIYGMVLILVPCWLARGVLNLKALIQFMHLFIIRCFIAYVISEKSPRQMFRPASKKKANNISLRGLFLRRLLVPKFCLEGEVVFNDIAMYTIFLQDDRLCN